jgi:hypothetical protein
MEKNRNFRAYIDDFVTTGNSVSQLFHFVSNSYTLLEGNRPNFVLNSKFPEFLLRHTK